MSINANIKDPTTGIQANVVDHQETNALVVATRPLKTYENNTLFFTNNDYGNSLNQNAIAAGTPINVHNGLDNTYWTGSAISGNMDFNDSGRAHSGTSSIGFDSWVSPGDTAQIAKGSDQDLTGYLSVTMYVNINNNWESDSVSFYGWDTGTGTIVGNKVYLEDYLEVSNNDVWQKVTISISDMGLTAQTIDAFRFQYELRERVPVNFYIDDIQIQETGEPIVFSIKPEKGTWLYVHNFTYTFVNNVSTVLADSSMPDLSYDEILGETLASGLLYQRLQYGDVQYSTILTNLIDILQLPNTEIISQGSDGTNSFIVIRTIFTEPLLLKAEESDELLFVVRDNLSGFLRFKITAGTKKEYRTMHGKYEYYSSV